MPTDYRRLCAAITMRYPESGRAIISAYMFDPWW